MALYVTSGPAPAGSRTVADRPWRRWRSGRCSCHPRCTHAWRGHPGRPSLYPWSGTPQPGPRPSASRRAWCASHGNTTSSRTGMCKGTSTSRMCSRRWAGRPRGPGCLSSPVRWPAAARCSTPWRIMSTTTTLCTETSAPFASGPSLLDTCWTPTSWSGMTPSSRFWPSGRTCISAWWRAARRSSEQAETGRSTW